MVLAPAFKLMLPLALPDATAVPLTVTVALAWLTVGVTVIEDTASETVCVYVVVPLEKAGVSAPLENVSPDKSACVEAAAPRVTVVV
jgi:hypothetical protein